MQAIIEFLFHLLGEYTIFKLINKHGRAAFRVSWEKSSFWEKINWVFWNFVLGLFLIMLFLICFKVILKGFA